MFEKDKLIAAIKRAAWTVIQTIAANLLILIPEGSGFEDVNWLRVISICVVAAILSFAKSIVAGMPETDTAGTLYIDTSDPATDRYQIEMKQLEGLSSKRSVQLRISTDKKLEGDVKYVGE